MSEILAASWRPWTYSRTRTISTSPPSWPLFGQIYKTGCKLCWHISLWRNVRKVFRLGFSYSPLPTVAIIANYAKVADFHCGPYKFNTTICDLPWQTDHIVLDLKLTEIMATQVNFGESDFLIWIDSRTIPLRKYLFCSSWNLSISVVRPWRGACSQLLICPNF